MAGRLGHLFRCHKNVIFRVTKHIDATRFPTTGGGPPPKSLSVAEEAWVTINGDSAAVDVIEGGLDTGSQYVCRQFHREAARCEKWQLMSAVCLERFPILTSPLSEMEQKFSDMVAQEELENSKLGDHELRHMEDRKAAERRKQDNYEETEMEAVRQTAAEAEDGWEAERKTFTPADRTTDADYKNDQKSTERKLDRKLVLVMKQRLGSQSHWVLPQGSRVDGESMRQTAERVLSEACGGNLEALFMGNAPCGFFKYRYDKPTPEGVGAKVFFFKAQMQRGAVETKHKDFEDFLWLTKEELPQHFGASYERTADKFILEL